MLYIGSNTVTLATGSYENTTVCLFPGDYSPYACGGGNPNEVRWSVGGLSGTADSFCMPSSGVFHVGPVPTSAPTTTLAPTISKTSAPTPHPTDSCINYKVVMSDTFGKGSPRHFSALNRILQFALYDCLTMKLQ